MRKDILIVASLLGGFFLGGSSKAQLVINGGSITIGDNAFIAVQGDLTSNADILGNGKIVMNGTSAQQMNMNGFTLSNLEINSTANVALGSDAKISSGLTFTNGKIQTGNFNFVLANTATVTGASSTNYFVTNGTGKLIREQLGSTPFTFPVGATATSYTPIAIGNSGTVDNIGVRVGDNVLSSGLTGSPVTKEVVDASWEITEAAAGGSNLNITANWKATDELAGFDRTKAGLSYYDGVGWDLTNAMAGAATGSNPYSFTRSAAVPGMFAVGRRPVMTQLLISPKIFLQGPYNAGTHLMNDNLRAASLIPLNTPYDAMSGFTVAGSGGGETIDPSVLAVTGNNAIVDWVFAQLHDGATGSVISTRSVLIQKDGDLVETDGTTPVNFAGFLAGNYYVSLKHRNHMAVRTSSKPSLARTTSTNYNFTTSQNQAYAGSASNPPMAAVEGTVFGMYGGNANSDGTVKKIGSATTNDYSLLLTAVGSAPAPGPTGVYRREDFNMDGNVRKTGSSTSNDYSKLLSILGSTTILTQPSF